VTELDEAQGVIDAAANLLDAVARVDPESRRFPFASDRRRAEKAAAAYRAARRVYEPGRERRRLEAAQENWRRLGAWYERRRQAPDLGGL
jgi:hypothetical protein